MNRRLVFIVLAFVVALVNLSSCDQSIDNFYTEKERIQFQYYKEDTGSNDLIRRTYFNKWTSSFGMYPKEVAYDTARIVVEFLGSVSDKDRTYRVLVGQDSTTAIEGVHYEPFSSTQTFRAGRMKDTLKIVVLRSQLSPSFFNPEDRRLVLDLENTQDFNLGMKRGLRTNLYINNYLSEPVWWKDSGRQPQLGFYHPEKWKILISFHPDYSDPEKCRFDINNEGREHYNSLSRYLNSVPTFDEETGYRIYMNYMEQQD